VKQRRRIGSYVCGRVVMQKKIRLEYDRVCVVVVNV
jgi:hypothetical protein